jgi:pimeloyl-ACP methyl ester carboxylesterase
MRVLLVLVTALALAAGFVDGTRIRAADNCTPRAGDVSFRAGDGTRLVGHRYGHGTTGVVLAHQSDGTLCQWVPYAKRLAGLGYLVVVFDFRGSGDSQYRSYPANRRWGGDVAAAVKVARSAGATKVGLVGASLGGSAVISAAANVRPRVAGVVSVSGSADLADALAAAKRLRVPSLFLAAKGDRDFAPDVARFTAATTAPKQGVVLPGYQHGVQLVAASARTRSLIETFIRAR